MAWLDTGTRLAFCVTLVVSILVWPCTVLSALAAGTVLLRFPSADSRLVLGLLAAGVAADSWIWAHRARLTREGRR